MIKFTPIIVGLGYVGLPIFLRLSKKIQTIGFDIDNKRIQHLKKKIDDNKEYSAKDLNLKNNSYFLNKLKSFENKSFFIVTVPTPILKNKTPNLKPLILACNLIKKNLKDGDIIFFESTVFPGLTRSLKKNILEIRMYTLAIVQKELIQVIK